MARYLSLFTILVVLTGCAANAKGPVNQTAAGTVAHTGSGRVVYLPAEGGAIHVLADDIDGDGSTDLALTSHGGNYAQVFFQRAAREFSPGPRSPVVGFHPNDLIRLPGEERLYLSNAEGEQRLMVLRPAPDGSLQKVAERNAARPRASTLFRWPGWGDSFIVAPYAGSFVVLLKDFQAETAKAEHFVLTLGSYKDTPRRASVADLDRDGIDELLFTTYRTNEVWVVRYPGPGVKPKAEPLWKFSQGWSRYVIPLDVNGDKAPDLLFPQGVDKKISVLMNDGKGNFSPGKDILFPKSPGPNNLFTAVDKDGTLYLAAGNYDILALYRLHQDKWEVQALPVKGWPTYIELKDIDGDGALDLAASVKRFNDSGMVIFGDLWTAFRELIAAGGVY